MSGKNTNDSYLVTINCIKLYINFINDSFKIGKLENSIRLLFSQLFINLSNFTYFDDKSIIIL